MRNVFRKSTGTEPTQRDGRTNQGRAEPTPVLPMSSFRQFLKDNKRKTMTYLRQHDIYISDLDLTPRAFHSLRLCGFRWLSEFVLMEEAQLVERQGILPDCAKEISQLCAEYLSNHREDLLLFLNPPEHAKTNSQTRAAAALERKQTSTARTQPEFADGDDRPIEELNLSARAYHVLKRSNIRTIAQLSRISDESLLFFRNMGKKTLEEIKTALQALSSTESTVSLPFQPEGAEAKPDQPDEESKPDDRPIEELNLSTRGYNCLKRANIHTIRQLSALSAEDLAAIRNMGKKTADEIAQKLREYLPKEPPAPQPEEDVPVGSDTEDDAITDNRPIEVLGLSVRAYLPKESLAPQPEEVVPVGSDAEDASIPDHRPIEVLGLSVRACNCLHNNNVLTVQDLLKTTPEMLLRFRNVGKTTVEEIETLKLRLREESKRQANSEAASDATVNIEMIKDFVLQSFTKPFEGLSWKDFRELLPNAVGDDAAKQAIGALIGENKLEYVDYRCYLVYPKFYQYLQEKSTELKPRLREVLTRRYSGQTLEGIAQDLGLTRERVRQLQKKALEKLRLIQYDVVFDEDYYEPLYTTYDVPASFWRDEVNIAEESLNYLKQTFASGKKPLEEALEDETISVGLRYRIRAYLDSGKVKIDGALFPPKLIALMDCAVKKYAEEEITLDQFSERYNEMLARNGIPATSDFYINEENKRGRASRLSASMYCLWKQGECLRYYDIMSRDYAELLEGLHLDSYQNTELSTSRFVELYPGLMRRYDVRDANELHNLLRKISGRYDLGGVHFSRQPVLTFGVFDRRAAIREIIEAFQPITTQELLDYLSSEYGYDRGTATGYLTPFKQYYHKGVYTIDFKKIPNECAAVLKSKLQEDFYFIDDIKEMYLQLFPDRDPEEINPYSLKALGFLVLSKYVIQHHDSALAYFTDLLTKQEVYDIGPMLSRYGTIQMFNQCYYELLKQNEIFLFDKGQIITMRRLNRVGVNKDMIHDYCDAVREELQDGQYFTIPSLRNDGFEHPLDDLGFDDYFYASLLGNVDGFVSQRIFGSVVLYCGSDAARISAKSFLYAQLLEYESVDIDDFISDIEDRFGVVVPNHYEVRDAVAGTELYYDPIMEKIYRDKSIYYSEFDD